MPGTDTHFQGRVLGNVAGSALASADFAASAGFGSTATVTPLAGSSDSRFHIDVLCQGSGIAANPTVTLTFKDGTWLAPGQGGVAAIPFAVVSRGDAQAPAGGYWQISSITATTIVLKFVGTPVTATTYSADVIVAG